MKVLVNQMPNKKEECLFYRREIYSNKEKIEYCCLNNRKCSFRDEESIFGANCRCLEVGLFR